jgi:glycosyltransferase involved in cell wall biosynthesis
VSTVDAVVPCYRYAHFLVDCVESLLTQERVDIRVLIIDDCSPDDTEVVAARLVAQDPRVHYRRHTSNCGHIATYNEGLLEWATGEYCILLSADDMLLPGALERAVAVMDRHPEVGFVHGKTIKGPSAEPWAPKAGEYEIRIEPGEAFVRSVCATGVNPVDTPSVVVRTAMQHRVGGYSPRLPKLGDLDMWLRLSAIASVGYVDTYQALYRRHGQNMSLTTPPDRKLRDFKETVDVLTSVLRHRDWGGRATAELEDEVKRTLVRQALGGADVAFVSRQEAVSREFLELARQVDPALGRGRQIDAWARRRLKRLVGPEVASTLRAFAVRWGLSRADDVRTRAWQR